MIEFFFLAVVFFSEFLSEKKHNTQKEQWYFVWPPNGLNAFIIAIVSTLKTRPSFTIFEKNTIPRKSEGILFGQKIA